MRIILVLCLQIFFLSDVFGAAISPFNLSSQQLETLRETKTEMTISSDDFHQLDKVVDELLIKSPLNTDTSRLMAYLYNAQKAFADASFSLTGSYAGTLKPITMHVLKLFYPDYQNKYFEVNDAFSQALTRLLSQEIDARFKQEKAQIHPITVETKPNQWQGTVPYTGLNVPTMLPWILQSANEYRVAQPPSDDEFWQDQLAQVKSALQHATESQKQQILYWAGMSPPGSGDFINIANQYMSDRKTPVSKQLEVRAMLASVSADAMIAVFDSKYAYMVRRPFMIDKGLKTYIPTPNHPSYPAGHSVGSSSAEVILSFYFPENKNEWRRLAVECGMSRIWAGIHFPIDDSIGNELGTKVGEAGLKTLKSSD